MSSGILRVQTFAARQSAPVPEVTVTVTGPDGESYQFTTDSEGNAPDLTLPTPDEAYSLDENNTTVQPYSTWDVTVSKAGYTPMVLRGVQLFACQTTLAPIELIPAEGDIEVQGLPTVVEIPPHSLFVNQNSRSGPNPVEACVSRVLTQPIIPTNITVHLGRPAASATNVTVSFRKYIANVASSEVYPTWPEQTKPIIGAAKAAATMAAAKTAAAKAMAAETAAAAKAKGQQQKRQRGSRTRGRSKAAVSAYQPCPEHPAAVRRHLRGKAFPLCAHHGMRKAVINLQAVPGGGQAKVPEFEVGGGVRLAHVEAAKGQLAV